MRSPLLYQAGASSRGRQFAATHAECVLINGPSKQVIAPIVADIRRRAAAAGRKPAEILIFTMMTVVTAATSEAARAKLKDYRSSPSWAKAKANPANLCLVAPREGYCGHTLSRNSRPFCTVSMWHPGRPNPATPRPCCSPHSLASASDPSLRD